MSAGLREMLLRLQAERREERLRYGWAHMPTWLFCDEDGLHFLPHRAANVFRAVLRRAGLPLHFSTHSLRHTFASIHIRELGSRVSYVKEQLGHASIQMTYDIYGSWLEGGDQEAADRLDEVNGL